jgi:hypothetical protein
MGVGTDIWLAAAIGCTVAGYALYLAGLARHALQPNRASWLIWCAATGVEAATYAAVNPHAPQRWVFYLATAACAVIALALWRRSRWSRPSAGEAACMAACLGAVLVWGLAHTAFWAHMLVVAAVPVSFWPTWQGVWRDRAAERSPAWGLWTVGDLATLIVAARTGEAAVGELGYIVVELVCHASVWFMVGLASIFPWRTFAWESGRLRAVDAGRPDARRFVIGETHLGQAVFAAAPFAQGETICRVAGRRYARERVPAQLSGRADRYVQVAPGEYLGPSGSLDDLVNHSCAPNAGLRFADGRVELVAIRPIAAGEEIAWDYSTSLAADDGWQMACRCGAPECRGTIGAFASLPPERQAWYRARGLVAPHLLDPPAERAA